MVLDIGEPEKMETILGKESCGLLFVGIAREWEKMGKRVPPPETGNVESQKNSTEEQKVHRSLGKD